MIATKQSSLKTNDTNAAQIKSLAFEDKLESGEAHSVEVTVSVGKLEVVSGVELIEETLEAAVSVVEPQSPSL